MTNKSQAVQKSSPANIFENVWWRPFFSMQKEMTQNFRNSLSGTPFEAMLSAQENIFEKLGENASDNFGEAFNNIQMAQPLLMGDHMNPFIDIVENKNAYKLKAELPGVKEKDLNIQFFDGGIQIDGEKYEESAEKGENYRHQECHVGHFSRVIALPEDADLEKAKTRFNLNILTIEVPKKERSLSPNARSLKMTVEDEIVEKPKAVEPAKKVEVAVLHGSSVKKEEKKFVK